MFNFNSTPHAAALDSRISELLEELDALTGSTDEYTSTAKNLATLMELKDKILKTGNETTKIENEELKLRNDHIVERDRIATEQDKLRLEEEKFAADQQKEKSWKPSPDAVVSAAASVAGILFVLHYEKLGVVTSKALGFIGKMK